MYSVFDSRIHVFMMNFPAFASPKSPFNHNSIRRSLALFFTNNCPSQPLQSNDILPKELEESMTNRTYWTKKIHHLCTVTGDVDEAIRLLDNLRLRGYQPHSLNLSTIIHALCLSNRFPEAHRRLILSVSSGCIPDERTCNVLIARLLDSKTPDATLDVVRCLIQAKPEFVPSLINYNRLMDQLCSFSRPDEAHGLFYDMMNRGHKPNTVSYTTLINGYSKNGDTDSAQKVFDEMLECGVLPNSLTYSVLVRGVLRNRDDERIKELISKLWATMADEINESISSAAFANLVDSLCREGLFHKVFSIAEDMPQKKSVCDEFAYGEMIDSLCRYGRHHGASRIVYIMRKRGLIPSLSSYNSIVHGLSKSGGCMRAFQLLEEGIEFGYLPSEYTYKILMESLCQESDLCKAKKVLDLMIKENGADNTRIYNIYLRAISLMNNPTELLNSLVNMLQTKCEPDVITLNTVINGFCKTGRVEEPLKVLQDMMSGKFCAPDSVTFTTIITGLLTASRIEEALDLFQNIMPQNGYHPTVVTYNAVLHGLCKLRFIDKAMKIFKTMASGCLTADSTTYTILIDGLCECGRIEDAKKLWDEVIWPSKIHDTYVYSAIIKGLCRSGRFNEACDFVYELVDCGVTPNIVNYNILINGVSNQGLKKEVYQILGEMKKNGVGPDAVTWRIIDKLHKNLKKEFCDESDVSVNADLI